MADTHPEEPEALEVLSGLEAVARGECVICPGGVAESPAVAEGLEMGGASSTLYPALKWPDMALANVIVILLGIITSLLPSWRASLYNPVEAIAKI